MDDWEYVNFSQDHELNDHLKKANKRQTESNREVLRTMGNELKESLNKKCLTHAEFDKYINKNLDRLD